MMKTTKFSHKEDKNVTWYLLDAANVPVGRLATMAAFILRGKHRPDFTPNVDHGDHVIVINASNIKFTGRKLDQKIYRHHTGYPGGMREITASKLIQTFPDRIVLTAVRGMLPKSRLGRKLLKNIRVFAGKDHTHEAQQPIKIKISEEKIISVDNTKA